MHHPHVRTLRTYVRKLYLEKLCNLIRQTVLVRFMTCFLLQMVIHSHGERHVLVHFILAFFTRISSCQKRLAYLPKTVSDIGIVSFLSTSSWYETWHSYSPESATCGLVNFKIHTLDPSSWIGMNRLSCVYRIWPMVRIFKSLLRIQDTWNKTIFRDRDFCFFGESFQRVCSRAKILTLVMTDRS